ncbi:MAG: hypothetical protein DLM68_04040 [Hyphomicrobiales bacterium]|nr:MAG: hypothetical protein DLM68_04040 [Hyphomicrobiales bacterium]
MLNLFPIPLLDGGHLLYYAVEAVRGKAMNDKLQRFGFKGRRGVATSCTNLPPRSTLKTSSVSLAVCTTRCMSSKLSTLIPPIETIRSPC